MSWSRHASPPRPRARSGAHRSIRVGQGSFDLLSLALDDLLWRWPWYVVQDHLDVRDLRFVACVTTCDLQGEACCVYTTALSRLGHTAENERRLQVQRYHSLVPDEVAELLVRPHPLTERFRCSTLSCHRILDLRPRNKVLSESLGHLDRLETLS